MPGYYSITGSSVCTIVPRGFIANISSILGYSQCPLLTSNAAAGSTSCSLCASGNFYTTSTAGVCLGLLDGMYNDIYVSSMGIVTSVYCIGGFVLLAKMDGRLSTWYYGSQYWTSATPSPALNPDSLLFNQVEARLDAYSQVLISSVRVGFAPFTSYSDSSSAVRSWLTIPLAESSTLLSLMSTSTVTATLARSDWDNAIGGSSFLSGEPNCNLNGINVAAGSTGAAW